MSNAGRSSNCERGHHDLCNGTNGMYAELHCLSNFSFLRGASHPGELVKTAAELGYAGLALTDECSDGRSRARAYGGQGLAAELVVGSELTCEDGLKVVVLAEDGRPYAALCGLISRARRAAPKGEYRVGRADLAERLQSRTVCCSGCRASPIRPAQEDRVLVAGTIRGPSLVGSRAAERRQRPAAAARG